MAGQADRQPGDVGGRSTGEAWRDVELEPVAARLEELIVDKVMRLGYGLAGTLAQNQGEARVEVSRVITEIDTLVAQLRSVVVEIREHRCR